MLRNFVFCIAFVYITRIVHSVELTFELADNAKECFYEEIKANQTATLEFQVNEFNKNVLEKCVRLNPLCKLESFNSSTY